MAPRVPGRFARSRFQIPLERLAGSDLGEDAISTIAAHAGPEAFAALRSLVEDRRLAMRDREKALFWLVLAGSDERFDYIENLIAGN